MTKALTWKEQSHKYGPNSHICYAGRIVVGEACWNNAKSRGEEGVDYRYGVRLPGLKEPHGKVATLEEAKRHIETKVQAWFRYTDTPAT